VSTVIIKPVIIIIIIKPKYKNGFVCISSQVRMGEVVHCKGTNSPNLDSRMLPAMPQANILLVKHCET